MSNTLERSDTKSKDTSDKAILDATTKFDASLKLYNEVAGPSSPEASRSKMDNLNSSDLALRENGTLPNLIIDGLTSNSKSPANDSPSKYSNRENKSADATTSSDNTVSPGPNNKNTDSPITTIAKNIEKSYTSPMNIDATSSTIGGDTRPHYTNISTDTVPRSSYSDSTVKNNEASTSSNSPSDTANKSTDTTTSSNSPSDTANKSTDTTTSSNSPSDTANKSTDTTTSSNSPSDTANKSTDSTTSSNSPSDTASKSTDSTTSSNSPSDTASKSTDSTTSSNSPSDTASKSTDSTTSSNSPSDTASKSTDSTTSSNSPSDTANKSSNTSTDKQKEYTTDMSDAQVAFWQDNHPNMDDKNEFIQAMQSLKDNGVTSVLIEGFKQNEQKLLDAYVKSTDPAQSAKDRAQLKQDLENLVTPFTDKKENDQWYEKEMDIVDAAKKANMHIIAAEPNDMTEKTDNLDKAQKAKQDQISETREVHWDEAIRKELNKNPDGKIVVFADVAHVTDKPADPNHQTLNTLLTNENKTHDFGPEIKFKTIHETADGPETSQRKDP